MKLHCGINTTGITGDGLEDLPGVLIVIAFIFLPLGIFVPREWDNWLLAAFIGVEIAASVMYLVSARRSRKETERLRSQLHKINEPPG